MNLRRAVEYWARPLPEGFARWYWLVFAVATSGLVLALSTVWVLGHPYPTGWDEAQYNSQLLSDAACVQAEGLVGVGKVLLCSDTARPPAFRVFVLPVILTLGVSPIALRFVSLAFFPITLLFIYLAAARVGGRVAGAFAVLALASCPEIVSATQTFGTEYPLYLATAATLYYLAANWDRREGSARDWIGLGLALGLGAWSKASFALIGGPAVLLTLVLSRRKAFRGPGAGFLVKSVFLAAILAAPWWLLNGREAIRYAWYASNFARHSIGSTFGEVLVNWSLKLTLRTAGPLLTLLVLAVLLTPLLSALAKRKTGMSHGQTTSLWLGLLTPVPLALVHLLGSNHNMRLLSPALVPFAVAFGVVAGQTSWSRARPLAAGVSVAICLQLVMMAQPLVYPQGVLTVRCTDHPSPYSPSADRPGDKESGVASLVRAVAAKNPIQAMAARPQWDWQVLREKCRSLGMDNPSIGYLGNYYAFNEAQIKNAWLRHGESVKVEWLWRYDEARFDWARIEKLLADKDVVLTIPQIRGRRLYGPLRFDNLHNAEFVERLRRDARFSGPIVLPLVEDGYDEVIVFTRKPVQTEH